MYKKPKYSITDVRVNVCTEGESIEQKMERVTSNKEPITDGAPLTYTERKDGVNKAYDIRTDRFEVAVEAMDKVSASIRARREEKHNPKLEIVKDDIDKEVGGAESTQGTE